MRGFAGRINPHPDGLAEAIREALKMASIEDPRFGGSRRASSECNLTLWFIQAGEALTPDHPLQQGEGVAVVKEHWRGSALPEGMLPGLEASQPTEAEPGEVGLPEESEELLGRACVAAGLAPTAHREEGVELTRLLMIRKVDLDLGR